MKRRFQILSKNLAAVLVLFVTLTNAYAQQRITVKGQVTDASTGEPLPGAAIIEKGTSNGTSADIDGNYQLTVPAGSTLIASFIGYVETSATVSTKTVVNIAMSPDSQFLDDVVVIGYGTARKSDLTGAIASIKTEEMETEAPRSIEDLLHASAAGVKISFSTDIKGSSSIQIRGKNTLTAGSSPLVVLDGVIFDGSLNDINPMDIQSIDVLKDASSVAVYGAKAANGVIAITTKKGKEGAKPVLQFNTNIGFAQAANLAPVVDGEGFLKFRQEYFESRMSDDEYNNKYKERYVNPKMLTSVDQLTWYNYDQSTPATSIPDEETLIRTWLSRLSLKAPEIENYLAGRITNWDDELFQTGLQQDYTVSLSKRTDDTSYYWSVGYVDRDGIKAQDWYKGFRTRLNLESSVTNFLKVGINMNYSMRDNSATAVSVDARETFSPYAANEIDNPDSPYRMSPTGDGRTTNPFFNNLFRDRYEMSNNLAVNAYAIVKLPWGFEFQSNFSPRLNWTEYFDHKSSENPSWAGKGGETDRQHEKKFHWQVDNVLRWKHEINKHRFEATFLQNAEQGRYWKTLAESYQYSPSDVLSYHNIGAGTVPSNSSNDTYYTGDALMARLFYSYADKYMLTASVRRDGYSAFGQKNPRATFPAVALGWVFTKEKFAKSMSSWLDYGKLRLSWGKNGNRDIGQYSALASMTSKLYPLITNSGQLYTSSLIYISTMANSELKWERTESWNIGLDFSMFNNRLSGAVEGYLSTTKDLLVKRSLPDIVGYSSVMANLGMLKNKGLEITLKGTPVSKKDFKWNITGGFSLNRRTLVHLYGDMEDVYDDAGHKIGQKESDDIANKWFIGHDPDQIWELKRDGIWQLGEEAEAARYGLQPGDFKYIDQNDDGILDTKDKVFQGYTTPRYYINLRNDFTYKSFNLAINMYSNLGWYGTFNDAANARNDLDMYTVIDQPRWTRDNPINDYARLNSINKGNNYVRKNFLRCESISLSYGLPKSFARKIHMQQCRVAISARNPFIITSYHNGDPEGGDYTMRSFNLNLSFTL